MMTPPMFYPQEDGKLAEIPDEHAKILDLYRDRMPLVHEPQFSGDPIGLYPLIVEEQEPQGTPEPSALESAARRVADRLECHRRNGETYSVDVERLAVLAMRAHIEHEGVFAGSLSHDDGPQAVERSIKAETARAGRKLTKAVETAVTAVAADLVEKWWVNA